MELTVTVRPEQLELNLVLDVPVANPRQLGPPLLCKSDMNPKRRPEATQKRPEATEKRPKSDQKATKKRPEATKKRPKSDQKATLFKKK